MRVVGIDIDSPEQHAAMIEKLSLPFPMLSDPDRSKAIGPLNLSNPTDERNIAIPALVLIDRSGVERWRFVSRDFADRLPEDEVIEAARDLGLPATTQQPPEPGDPVPGPKAMPFEGMSFYFRGARFAAQVMGLRHAHLGDSVKNDSKAYVAEMDRFMAAVAAMKKRRSG